VGNHGFPCELVAAAAGAAAAASAGRGLPEARLRVGAVGGEDGELLLHLRAAAVGTRRLLPVSDELLEVRLALHADVFVDRHRIKSSVGAWLQPGTDSLLRHMS
jgi:hypothetical protein